MILLLHQNELIQESVRSIVDGENLTVVTTLPYAVELASQGGYCVAVVEPRQYPGAVRGLSKLLPVVVLTESLDGRDARQAMKDGAVSYLHVSCRTRDLRDAVKKAKQGTPTLDAKQAAEVIGRLERSKARAAVTIAETRLTVRQMEVLKLLATGMQDKSIGENLELGVGYIQTVVSDIYDRLGVSREQGDNPRVKAAAWAWEVGLVEGGGE